LRNIYGRYINIKETGEARGRVVMIGWENPRKGKRMQKKLGRRNVSIVLNSIMNQNILNSNFIITSNCSFFSASTGQAVTSCQAKLGVLWEDARKETGKDMVMQFRTRSASHETNRINTSRERKR
jgi:hypothetical protein